MTDKLIIRLATDADIPDVAGLWKAMCDELGDMDANPGMWQMTVRQMTKTNFYYLLVAEIADKIVGFVDGMNYPDAASNKMIGHANSIYVEPGHRMTSVAARLSREITRIALANKCKKIKFAAHLRMVDFWMRKGWGAKAVVLEREVLQYGNSF